MRMVYNRINTVNIMDIPKISSAKYATTNTTEKLTRNILAHTIRTYKNTTAPTSPLHIYEDIVNIEIYTRSNYPLHMLCTAFAPHEPIHQHTQTERNECQLDKQPGNGEM